MLNIAPVTLEGKYVRLEPLRHAHIEESGRQVDTRISGRI